jgi:hypothetical protein
MTGLTKTFEDLPGWTFEVEEMSAGVFRVKGSDATGGSLEVTGTDPSALLEDCRRAAARLRFARR